jgi:hypothetical protein
VIVAASALSSAWAGWDGGGLPHGQRQAVDLVRGATTQKPGHGCPVHRRRFARRDRVRPGSTEAINLVAQSWGRANIGAGDEIVISHLEYHANIVLGLPN